MIPQKNNKYQAQVNKKLFWSGVLLIITSICIFYYTGNTLDSFTIGFWALLGLVGFIIFFSSFTSLFKSGMHSGNTGDDYIIHVKHKKNDQNNKK